MQYQNHMSRDELVQLAIEKYFGSVDAKDLDGTMDCFHDEAVLTVQTAFTVHAGKANIRRMFVDFFDAYDVIIHRDFNCTVDDANGRITASFVAELTNPDGSKTYLENTNFWRVREGRFQEVYVYMSGENPLI
jgi:ketosteroid isomerase-like protein